MFGICVFGDSGYCQILRQDFLLMQMNLCPDLELSMGNYSRIRRNSVLLGLSFSLDPVIQADTPIEQCLLILLKILLINNLFLYPEHLGFWPIRKTNTLLCLENIKRFFLYNTQTD